MSDFQDDGGTPAWRARHRRSPGEILAGSRRWRQWSPARKLAFCFGAPFWLAGCVIAGAVGMAIVLELAGVIR